MSAVKLRKNNYQSNFKILLKIGLAVFVLALSVSSFLNKSFKFDFIDWEIK